MIFFIKTDKTEEKSLEIKIIPTKLKGEINIPPSKSYSHRAVIAAALADGESRIDNLNFSVDIQTTTDIMKNYGVDSKFGLMSAVIMGSTETTFYTIAVYSASVGIKKTRFVLFASLVADFVGIFVSVLVCNVI